MKRVSLLMITSLMLPLGLAACGSDDEGEGEDGPPEGEHYQSVVATIDPRSNNRLDIDGNGMSENQLGELVNLLTLVDPTLLDTIDNSVKRASVLLLADVQTSSFSASGTAGVSFFLGDSATAMPTPCTDTTMIATCGKHLAGTGTFTIAATSPRDTLLTGKFAAGTFKAGPGKLAVQIALTGDQPITVNLIGARAQLSSVTADGIGKGILGGAISQTELDGNVLPTITSQLEAVLTRDCGPLNARVVANACSCMPMSTGRTLVTGATSFDTAPQDCAISIDEIKNNALIKTALKMDIMVDNQPALSVGLGFTTKKATFAQ